MPIADHNDDDRPQRVARIVAGLFLIGIAGVIYVTDPNRPTERILAMLGFGGVFLGVDVLKRIIR